MSPDTALFDVSPTWGIRVRRHTEKPDGMFQGHGPPQREAQGPFHVLSRVRLCQGGGGGRPRRHKINGFQGRGEPPTHPAKILQRLPRPGSARREAEKDCGEEVNPCQPGEPHCLIHCQPHACEPSLRADLRPGSSLRLLRAEVPTPAW